MEIRKSGIIFLLKNSQMYTIWLEKKIKSFGEMIAIAGEFAILRGEGIWENKRREMSV